MTAEAVRVDDVRGVDCHAHVYDPVRHPYRHVPGYQRADGANDTPEQFVATLIRHGLSHGLAVGPAPYGTDNACLLDAIARTGGRLKGIGLVALDVSAQEIARLKAGGIVGIRLNFLHDGLALLDDPRLPALLGKLADADWFCQIQCEGEQLAAVAPVLSRAGVRVMVDHAGRPDVRAGVSQPAFQALLALGRAGRHVVKLSGPFRFSRETAPYADTNAYYAALVDAFTLDRCVWGSDWPFVRMTPIDYADALASLARWLPSASDRRKVLVDTPSRLFGFGAKGDSP